MGYLTASGRRGRLGVPGRAMGDVMSAADPFAALAAQVNRFAPGTAPPAYQVASRVFPLATGKLDTELALAAVVIYQRRATEAYNQFHDEGSAAAIAKSNAGFADPVTFVTSNLAEVTQTIANFADSIGLPPPITTAAGGEGGPNPLLLVAGLALVLWAVTR